MNRFAAMETFVRVVETGSFSTAAKHLNVGQPAVSKAVAQLEEHLQVCLLVRSSRGLMPTEAGQRFYERARQVIEQADEAEFVARGVGAGLSGRLRVSASATFASMHVVPGLSEFLSAHPNLTLDFVLDDRAISLVEEGIDIAFRIGSLPDSALTVRKLALSRQLVVGSPAYLERAGVPTKPTQLTEHAMVIYTQDPGGDHWTFRRSTSEMLVAVKSRLRVNAVEGVRATVLGGMGLAVASEWMFSPELASGAVRPVLTDWCLPPVDLWAVFPTARMINAKSRAFAAFVEAELQKSTGCAKSSRRRLPGIGSPGGGMETFRSPASATFEASSVSPSTVR